MQGENRHFNIGTRVLPEHSWGTTALVVPPLNNTSSLYDTAHVAVYGP
jgi:hypothetical protein